MVLWVPTDTPNNVNTVEKLAVWACMILNNLHFQDEIQEGPGDLQKVAIEQAFPVIVSGTYQHRQVVRLSTRLNAAYQHTGKKWQHIEPLSDQTIPANFKLP